MKGGSKGPNSTKTVIFDHFGFQKDRNGYKRMQFDRSLLENKLGYQFINSNPELLPLFNLTKAFLIIVC